MTGITKTDTIVIVTVIATLLSAAAAFADTTSRNTVQAPKVSKTQLYVTNGLFKSHLDSLVKDGVIKAKDDAIQSAVTIAKEDGTITYGF